jgi:hypothetical protein
MQTKRCRVQDTNIFETTAHMPKPGWAAYYMKVHGTPWRMYGIVQTNKTNK